MLAPMEPADRAERVDACLAELGVAVQHGGVGEWSMVLEAAGHPLAVDLTIRGALLRAEAAVLPADLIDPRQLLFWNRQAPLVCFAVSDAGEVLVCGEVPLQSLDADLLDRFLGLLLASATRARQFVLPAG
jgi:hypothetical protein